MIIHLEGNHVDITSLHQRNGIIQKLKYQTTYNRNIKGKLHQIELKDNIYYIDDISIGEKSTKKLLKMHDSKFIVSKKAIKSILVQFTKEGSVNSICKNKAII